MIVKARLSHIWPQATIFCEKPLSRIFSATVSPAFGRGTQVVTSFFAPFGRWGHEKQTFFPLSSDVVKSNYPPWHNPRTEFERSFISSDYRLSVGGQGQGQIRLTFPPPSFILLFCGCICLGYLVYTSHMSHQINHPKSKTVFVRLNLCIWVPLCMELVVNLQFAK